MATPFPTLDPIQREIFEIVIRNLPQPPPGCADGSSHVPGQETVGDRFDGPAAKDRGEAEHSRARGRGFEGSGFIGVAGQEARHGVRDVPGANNGEAEHVRGRGCSGEDAIPRAGSLLEVRSHDAVLATSFGGKTPCAGPEKLGSLEAARARGRERFRGSASEVGEGPALRYGPEQEGPEKLGSLEAARARGRERFRGSASEERGVVEEGPALRYGPEQEREQEEGGSGMGSRQRGTVLHDLAMLSVEGLSAALKSQNGPVSHFRLDSLTVSDTQLEEYLLILAERKVCEVVFVNRRWPSWMSEFQIGNLDNSDVQSISIAFCQVPQVFAYSMGSLQVLDLAHCTIESQDLYEFVGRCSTLKSLYIGYYFQDLRLSSTSLEFLEVWCSRMSSIAVENAPSLHGVTVSASPKESRKQLVVVIKNSPHLYSITCNISNQVIRVNSFDITEGKYLMPTVRKLYVGVKLSVARERRQLLNIFRCFSNMESMVLWRMDPLSTTEETDAICDGWPDKLETLRCLQSLSSLRLEGYRGGDTEVSIASTVIKHSASLRSLIIESDDQTILEQTKVRFRRSGKVNVTYRMSEKS